MVKRCCGTSVGVLIQDTDSRLLMVERGWWPIGIAPVAGHVRDAHTDAAEALVAEVREEVGLQVTDAELLWEGHLPNLCASLPATPPGHYWWLYRAGATGTLAPAAGETKGAAWYRPDEVQALADYTTAHARGEIPVEEFARILGLEAVWVEHLTQLGDIEVDPADRKAVRGLYTTPPPEYWLGGRA